MELAKERKGPIVTGIPKRGLLTFLGETKVGKSHFGASFPKSIVGSMEKGRTDRISYGRIHDISSLDEYSEFIELVMADDSIETVVLDTIDSLQDWLQEDCGLKKPITAGVDRRAQWGDYTGRIKAMTDYFKESDKLVVILGHKRAAVLDSDARVTKPAGLNVSGKGGDYILQQSEAVGELGTRVLAGVPQYYLSFKGTSDSGSFRSGIEELVGKEVILPKSNPYSAFASLFNKKEAAPIQLKEKKK